MKPGMCVRVKNVPLRERANDILFVDAMAARIGRVGVIVKGPWMNNTSVKVTHSNFRFSYYYRQTWIERVSPAHFPLAANDPVTSLLRVRLRLPRELAVAVCGWAAWTALPSAPFSRS